MIWRLRRLYRRLRYRDEYRSYLADYWAASTPDEERVIYTILHHRFGVCAYGER